VGENGAARLPGQAHPECPAAEEAQRTQVLLLQCQPARSAAAAVVELAGRPDAPLAGPQSHYHRGTDPQCGHHPDINLVSPTDPGRHLPVTPTNQLLGTVLASKFHNILRGLGIHISCFAPSISRHLSFAVCSICWPESKILC